MNIHIGFQYVISRIKEIVMPLVNRTSSPAAPAVVNVAKSEEVSASVEVLENGTRKLTIMLPPEHEYTDEEIQAVEAKERTTLKATCDISGLLICNAANVNKIQGREEFRDMVVCTKVLRVIKEAIEA